MGRDWRVPALGMLLLLGGWVGMTAAQSASPGGPTPGGLPPGGAGGGPISAAAIGIVVLAVLAVLVGVTKLAGLRKRRDDRAIELESRIAEALLQDQTVGAAVTPTVHLPFWRGSPAHIELSGRVSTPLVRQAAVRIATQEAARIRPDFEIKDRIAEVPPAALRVA